MKHYRLITVPCRAIHAREKPLPSLLQMMSRMFQQAGLRRNQHQELVVQGLAGHCHREPAARSSRTIRFAPSSQSASWISPLAGILKHPISTWCIWRGRPRAVFMNILIPCTRDVSMSRCEVDPGPLWYPSTKRNRNGDPRIMSGPTLATHDDK